MFDVGCIIVLIMGEDGLYLGYQAVQALIGHLEGLKLWA